MCLREHPTEANEEQEVREQEMSIETKQEIVTLIQEHQRSITNLGVEKLGLFGSFVREEQTDDSDVDVLVKFKPGQKTFDSFMRLAFLLEELLGRDVELVTPESLSPYIGPHILNEVEYVSFDVGIPATHSE